MALTNKIGEIVGQGGAAQLDVGSVLGTDVAGGAVTLTGTGDPSIGNVSLFGLDAYADPLDLTFDLSTFASDFSIDVDGDTDLDKLRLVGGVQTRGGQGNGKQEFEFEGADGKTYTVTVNPTEAETLTNALGESGASGPGDVSVADLIDAENNANVEIETLEDQGAKTVKITGEGVTNLERLNLDQLENITGDIKIDLQTFEDGFWLTMSGESQNDKVTLKGVERVDESSHGKTYYFTGADGKEHGVFVSLLNKSDIKTAAPGKQLGASEGKDNVQGGSGDDTVDAGAGDDTIAGGAGDDSIVAGMDQAALGGTGERSYDFPLIKLGQGPDIDPNEKNGVSEDARDLYGTYGDADAPLSGNIVFAYSNDLDQNDRLDDNDGGRQAETFTIEGQEIGLDSVQVYNAYVEFTDGTGGDFTAVVIQLENGEFFLAPEPFENADSALLQSKEIQSVRLDELIVDHGNLYGLRLDMAYKVGDDDEVDAGSGDDTISAGIGDDTIAGGAGADSVIGGAGGDSLSGGSGDDTILGGSGDDILGTGSGNDELYGGQGGDTLTNSSGDDLLDGGSGDDSLVANIGRDTLLGGIGKDTLIGGSGDDRLEGGVDNDSVSAGSGDDVAHGGLGDDTILGGDGDDLISAGRLSPDGALQSESLSGFTFNGANISSSGVGGGPGDTGSFVVFDNVGVTDEGTTIQARIMVTGLSDPSLDVNLGTTIILNGDGLAPAGTTADITIEFFDQATGQPVLLNSAFTFKDVESSSESVTLGKDDANTVQLSGNPPSNLAFADNGDTVTISNPGNQSSGPADENHWAHVTFTDQSSMEFTISSRSGGTNYDFATETFSADPVTVYEMEDQDSVLGGDGSDTILGGDGDDTLSGDDGADSLSGGSGVDQLVGGEGQDTIDAGAGDDVVRSDNQWIDETDFASVTDGPATDLTVTNTAEGPIKLWFIDATGTMQETATIQPGDTHVQATFEDHNWVLRDEDGLFLKLIEGAPNQTINYGADGLQDDVDAGSGDDFVDGMFGDDTLDGGRGADTIDGGEGDDVLSGGSGGETLSPVLRFDFQDGASATAADSSPNGVDGVYQALSAAGGTGWNNDPGDTAAVLPSGGYVEIPDNPAFQLDEGAIAIRFNASGADPAGTLVSRDSSGLDGGGHFTVKVLSDGSINLRMQDDATSYTIQTDPGLVSVGEWHQVVVTFGDDGMRLYVDGEERGSDAYTGGISGNNEPFTLGADQGVSGDGTADNLRDFFEGSLDEFVVLDKQIGALSVAAFEAGGIDALSNLGAADSISGGDGADTADGGDGSDTIDGGAGADSLSGASGDDSLVGGAGGDTLMGGAGSDSIIGGSGDDVIGVGTGQDSAYGGAGADTINNSSGDDSLVGGSGDDSITATDGADTLEGGRGADTLIGGTGDDSLVGGSGDDRILGSSGDDLAFGGADRDTFVLEAGFGADTIEGGEDGDDVDTLDFSNLTGPVTVTYTGDEAGTATDGVDTLTFSEIERIVLSSGDDVVFGGADRAGFEVVAGTGDDTITGGEGNNTVFGGAGADSFTGAADVGFDSVFGGSGDDNIDGGDRNDTIFGGAGDDVIDAGEEQSAGDDDLIFGGSGDDTITSSETDSRSNDTIFGGLGNDSISTSGGAATLDGGAGSDVIEGGTGDDSLTGASGDDTFRQRDGFGADVIDGGGVGSDYDRVDFGNLTGPVTVTYTGDESGSATDGADTLTFTDIERFDLTDGDDVVFGGATGGFKEIHGEGGDDSLEAGSSGTNILFGGQGLDTLVGGAANDTLSGQSGDDSITGGLGTDSISGGAGADTIDGGDSTDTVFGGAGDDSIVDTGGAASDDTIYGGSGDDFIDGGAREDLLEGGQGADTIIGGEGADTITGGTGDDSLTGGSGDDSITGGGGADLFSYSAGDGADTITDFGADDAGTLGDGDATNNDFIDLSSFYTDLNEARADLADDGVLNQSVGDFSDNTDLAGGSINLQGASVDRLTQDSTNLSNASDHGHVVQGSDTGAGVNQDGDDDFGGGKFYVEFIDNTGATSLLADLGFDTLTGGLGTATVYSAGETDNINIAQQTGAFGNDAEQFGARLTTTLDVSTGGVYTFTTSSDDGSMLFVNGVRVVENDGLQAETTESGSLQLDPGQYEITILYFENTGGDTLGATIQGPDYPTATSLDDPSVATAANAGSETVTGGAGADTFTGGAGADELFGGDGDDVFIIEDGFGSDTIVAGDEAGADVDTVDLSALSGPVTVTFGAGQTGSITDGADTLGFSQVERFVLTSGDDVVDGSSTSRIRSATIEGGAGSDTVDLGNGSIADTLFGGSGDDSLDAGDGADELYGGAGDDTLLANFDGGPGDLFDGGSGEDTYQIGGSDVQAIGFDIDLDAGSDTFTNQYVSIENVIGGLASDTVSGTSDANRLEGRQGDDVLDGRGGADTLAGDEGADTLSGGAGADSLLGGSGDDTFLFNDGFGADTIEGGEGGSDTDTLDFSNLTGPVTVTFTGGEAGTVTDGVDTLTFSEIERFILTSGDDVVLGDIDDPAAIEIVAGRGNDSVLTGDGNDTVFGGSGDDRLDGESGDDLIFGGAGDDSLFAESGDDQLFGGSGDDELYNEGGKATLDGGEGNDLFDVDDNDGAATIFGGKGVDTLDVDDPDASSGFDVTFSGDNAGNLSAVSNTATGTFTGIDVVSGSNASDTVNASLDTDGVSIFGREGADNLTGGSGADTLEGDSGDDSIVGGAGADSLIGGSGNDVLRGSSGLDTLFGGSGDDTITGGGGGGGGTHNDEIHGGAGNDQILADAGDNLVFGDSGDDAIEGSRGADTIFGGAGQDYIAGFDVSGIAAAASSGDLTPPSNDDGAADSLSGGSGDDIVLGGRGADTLDGGLGADQLRGGSGEDSITGGSGDDTISGGAGDDSLTGGAGFDVFELSSGDDTISDFAASGGALDDGDQTNNDFIDLSAFYDNISEVRADYADDLILNQSITEDEKGRTVDFTDNTAITGGTLFQGASASSFTADTTNVICYVTGARLATPTGLKAVEDLAPGDLVETLDHGARPVLWVGSQPAIVRLVRIAAGALGAGAPQRDLTVSPQHRMLVSGPIARRMFGAEEVLVPAKALTALPGVAWRDAEPGERLHHVLLARHEVLIAEGAPSESFYPGVEARGALSEPSLRALIAAAPRAAAEEAPRSARPLAPYKLARKLVERHIKNGKPLLAKRKAAPGRDAA